MELPTATQVEVLWRKHIILRLVWRRLQFCGFDTALWRRQVDGLLETLVEGADQVGLDRTTVEALHARLSEGLLEVEAEEGVVRGRGVFITGTTYSPLAIRTSLEERLELLLEKARAIPDPFEQSLFALVHVAYLQPFIDVNKRTARLSANIPLVKYNLCPLSFVDVPALAYAEAMLSVYENRDPALARDLYLWAYGRSAARFKVIRESNQPDLFRVAHREHLRALVRDVVRGLHAPTREVVREWATENGIPGPEIAPFEEIGLAQLVALNPASAGRSGLRPSEYDAWRAAFG